MELGLFYCYRMRGYFRKTFVNYEFYNSTSKIPKILKIKTKFNCLNSKLDFLNSTGHYYCHNVTGLKDISEICLEKMIFRIKFPQKFFFHMNNIFQKVIYDNLYEMASCITF